MDAPKVTGILETSLYVNDLQESIGFYKTVFRFPTLFTDHRMCALNSGPQQVLLLFLKGASAKATYAKGGMVPGSDGDGQLHLAFAIQEETLERWRQWLSEHNIAIESTVAWEGGGTSIYFRDPDGH